MKINKDDKIHKSKAKKLEMNKQTFTILNIMCCKIVAGILNNALTQILKYKRHLKLLNKRTELSIENLCFAIIIVCSNVKKLVNFDLIYSNYSPTLTIIW